MIPSKWPEVSVQVYHKPRHKWQPEYEGVKQVDLCFIQDVPQVPEQHVRLTPDETNVLISNLKEALLEMQK